MNEHSCKAIDRVGTVLPCSNTAMDPPAGTMLQFWPAYTVPDESTVRLTPPFTPVSVRNGVTAPGLYAVTAREFATYRTPRESMKSPCGKEMPDLIAPICGPFGTPAAKIRTSFASGSATNSDFAAAPARTLCGKDCVDMGSGCAFCALHAASAADAAAAVKTARA